MFDGRPHIFENPRYQADVLILGTDELPAVQSQNKASHCGLAFRIASIHSDQSATGFQSFVRELKQLKGLSVIEVMQHTRGQHNVKSFGLPESLCASFGAEENSAVPVYFLSEADHPGVAVKTHISDIRQVSENIPCPASDVQNAMAYFRPYVSLNINRLAFPTNQSLEKRIDKRYDQKASRVSNSQFNLCSLNGCSEEFAVARNVGPPVCLHE